MVIEPTGDKKGHYALFITKLSRSLSERGRRVIVVTNNMNINGLEDLSGRVEIVFPFDGMLRFIETGSGLKNAFRYWFQYYRNSLLVTYSALRIARERGIRDIYITDCEFFVASVLLMIISDPHRRIFMQINAANFSFSAYRGGLVKKIYKHIQTQFFRLAFKLNKIHSINVMGTWHAERIAQQLKLPSNFPIYVIPDGADLGDGPIDAQQAKKQLNLPPEKLILLVFGNFRKDKDYETLFKALSGIEGDSLGLILAGYPAEYAVNELNDMIDSLAIRSKILLTLFDYVSTDMVRLLFSASEALILPYGADYTDGSGPLRKEAATYKLPVIVSNVAEMGRLVKNHDLGLCYEAGDERDLIRILDMFMQTQENKRKNWGINCWKLGKENSWPVMAERFENVFHTCK